MAVSPSPHQHPDEDEGPAMLNPDDADEEIVQDDDEPMGSDNDDSDDDEAMEVELINDSIVYFDQHTDSLYSIAQHPVHPGKIILTGGGDDVAYVWEIPDVGEVKPAEAKVLQKLNGHQDSVVAGGWTRDGSVLVTAGLDGRVRSWKEKRGGAIPGVNGWEFVSEAQEVEEVQWMEFHPRDKVLAIGANDGSVWVYGVENAGELELRAAMYNHGGACTAGAWTPDGGLLVTVSDDGSFYAWDVVQGKAVVSLTAADARFQVDGGWVSIAANWDSTAAVCGSASGILKVVGLPRTITTTTTTSARGGGRGGGAAGGNTQAGQILATMATHTQSVESLSFSRSLPLLASSSVDGTIVIYDTSRNYTVRRTIANAHPNPRFPTAPSQPLSASSEPIEDNGENTVVKVEFINSAHPPTGIILTSCGVDGTIKRWDGRSGTELGMWRGHGDGVLGFVQTDRRIISSGDDHVALVFDIPQSAVVAGTVVPAVAGR